MSFPTTTDEASAGSTFPGHPQHLRVPQSGSGPHRSDVTGPRDSPAYLTGEYAHAFRDLDPPQRSPTLSAEDAARQHRARRGSLAHATLARTALTNHDLEAAAAAATTTVELAASARSSRSTAAVDDLRARLAPHTNSAPVSDLLDLADVLLPAPG